MPMEHVVTEAWPDQTYAVKPQPTPRRRSTPAKISIYKRNTNNQPKKRKAQIKSVAPEAFFCSCCSLALQLQKNASGAAQPTPRPQINPVPIISIFINLSIFTPKTLAISQFIGYTLTIGKRIPCLWC